MSIRKTILSVALVGAFVAPAFASGTTYAPEHGEATYSGPMPGNVTQQMPGAKSRADVMREVLLARQNGTLQQGQATYSGPMPGVKNRADGAAVSRDSVRQDPRAAQQNPVTADGYRFIGGEAGYAYVGTQTTH